MDVPVSGVSSLSQLLAQMFGSAAAAPGTPAPAALPPPSGAPALPQPGLLSGAIVGPGKGIPTNPAFTGAGMGLPQASTATVENSSTPQGQPQGRVLARLRGKDPSGDGAVKAVELAKGKSKWGAIASGLAAGMQAQSAAESELQKLLTAADNTLYTREKDDRALGRQDQLAGSTIRLQEAQTEAYRRGDYGRSGGIARGTTGSGRVVTPEERAARYGLAVQRFRQDGTSRGLTGPALDQFVDEQVRTWGIQRPELPVEPDANPAQDEQDNWSPTPGVVGRTFSRGWVAPQGGAPTPANPALGSGQPVQVPPGAPAGTPKVKPNGDASLARPASKADYDSLPSGSKYIHPGDGSVRTKQ